MAQGTRAELSVEDGAVVRGAGGRSAGEGASPAETRSKGKGQKEDILLCSTQPGPLNLEKE